MRFLADENFPGAGVAALRRRGHDVLSIGEVSRGASDAAVLGLATREDRVILTFDKDFGELARRSKLPDGCDVILFRIPLPAPAAAAGERVAKLVAARDDWAGHFSVIEPGPRAHEANGVGAPRSPRGRKRRRRTSSIWSLCDRPNVLTRT